MQLTKQQPVQILKAHVALNVKDVNASLEFYRRLLGIEPSKVRTGYAKFDVQNPPLNLTLNQHVFNERGALSHLGIQVASTDDVLAIRERWAEAGFVNARTKCKRIAVMRCKIRPGARSRRQRVGSVRRA
jgi:catechol 2,3-dioxygenase-like lactoylglutathione lyase family enzyme